MAIFQLITICLKIKKGKALVVQSTDIRESKVSTLSRVVYYERGVMYLAMLMMMMISAEITATCAIIIVEGMVSRVDR